MATITPVLWTAKEDSRGRSPIYIRIQAHRRRRLVSLGVKVTAKQWDADKGRVKRHERRDEINAIIADRVSQLEDEVYAAKRASGTVSVDHLKRVIKDPRHRAGNDFFRQARLYMDDLEANGQEYTVRRYRSVIGQFERFTGPTLALTDINVRLLRDYQNHRHRKCGNKPSTIASHFRAIKAIYRRARRDGIVSGPSPFDNFTVGNPRGERTRLTLSTIQRFASTDLERGSWPWHARNYYLFSFFAAGVRFGDLCRLRWRNVVRDGDVLRLEYTMHKTRRPKALKLTPPALSILAEYGTVGDEHPDGLIFPLVVGYDLSSPAKEVQAIQSRNALVNRYLKVAAEAAGISERLTYYSSRHSYADVARRSGASMYTISKALGHGSIKATEFYLKGFDEAGLDAHMDELFGNTAEE